MAAAYRVVDRTHAPLTAPLEDPNPSTAHLKIHWPSSFQRLQETTLQSNFHTGTDYSNAKPHGSKLGTDNLLVLNVYKTADHSPSWGLGPSPLSPLYLFYPVLHPADRSLPKPPKSISLPSPSAIFSPNKDRGILADSVSTRPNLIQFFLDRKDFSTNASSTMVCVRFLEEFVEWRLISKPHITVETKDEMAPNNQEDSADGNSSKFFKTRSFFNRLAIKKASSANSLHRFPNSTSPSTPTKGHARQSSVSLGKTTTTNQPRDMPAAHIFLTPTIRPVDQRRSKPLVNLFPSFVSDLGAGLLPMYTTLEEVAGQVGIEVFFSPGTVKKTYWWVWEDTSWRVIFDSAEKTSFKRGMKAVKERRSDKADTPSEVSRSGRSLARRDSAGEANERNLKSEPTSPGLKSPFKRSNSDLKRSRSSSLVKCGTVKLYPADQLEPVASVDFCTGQMWIVKNMLLDTIDITVAVMFAVVNLERAVEEEHEQKK